MKKTSIKDIARLSGVSVATVSRVINNNGRFSEETRQKVLQVIEETGYQMNFSAKSLRMNKSFSVGILVPDISNHFFADVVQKIEEILFEKGYSTIICNTARNFEKEQAYLKMLESKTVDGLIVISGADEFGLHLNDTEKATPYICIDREPKERDKTIFISSNHYQGAFEATEELLQNGVKTPVIVMHKRISSSSKERLKGFRDALKKNSIFEENILKLDLQAEDSGVRIEQYFKQHTEVDGVFAINDSIAMELLLALPRIGKQVPEDVKIVGFDDTPQARISHPTLSSVRQNSDLLAELAVENLLEIMNNPAFPKGLEKIVPVELVIRASSRM
ncbi:LacI family DNA-binding transcriptional regulator [Listeria costaricensis]|uniref:LacI family DNA-binding transcriptional regulator n=1 Tax=Listeria costaricensis TaxID=2026604 RepID=UPI000C0884B7|nr:LacI family DNA-binding transcriptional regulator [Listeria costaricensis]